MQNWWKASSPLPSRGWAYSRHKPAVTCAGLPAPTVRKAERLPSGFGKSRPELVTLPIEVGRGGNVAQTPPARVWIGGRAGFKSAPTTSGRAKALRYGVPASSPLMVED